MEPVQRGSVGVAGHGAVGPRWVSDLDRPGLRRAAYRAIVREGASEVQEELLNADLLRGVWPDLVLPDRCRQLWESRFPELAAQ